MAAVKGNCVIGFWAPGNAHCLPGQQMKDLALEVVKKCGMGRKVEGYKALNEKGNVGVWVYGAKKVNPGDGDSIDNDDDDCDSG